ncbi:hypothetical protein N7527_002929 [Penicillium freii]|nr:hypothetical protein N7527_002929 [Penicillium freii]
MSHSPEELKGIAIAGRVSSVLSILGSFTIIGAFALSRHFRSPIHRIIFINSFYNLFDSVATMISISGPAAGNTSSLCQFQGFALQMFPVADVLWTFAMALDTYLVVFYHFDTQALRKLETKYIGVITILSFIPAFAFLFIRDHKGPIYGDETIWCSVSRSWMLLRIIFYYAPVWFIIVIVLILYCLIGIEITRVRDEFKLSTDDHIALTSGNSTTSVTTTEEANSQRKHAFTPESTISTDDTEQHTSQHPPPSRKSTTTYQTPKQRRVSLRQYVIMPSLFFLAMLATWIAPTVNRISEFVNHKHGTYSLLVSDGRDELRRGEWLLDRRLGGNITGDWSALALFGPLPASILPQLIVANNMNTKQHGRSLIDLPLSIRFRIYNFAGLPNNEVIPLDRRHRVEEQSAPIWEDSARTLNLHLADLTIYSALILICRTTHDEVSHRFYSTNTFIAHDLQTLGRLGPSYLALLTSFKLIPCLTKNANTHKECTCMPLGFIDDKTIFGLVSPWDQSTLWEWNSIIGKIAPHLTGNRLDLSIICHVYNEDAAKRVVEPLRHLPVLSSCHIRLGPLNRRNYATQMIAMEAAKQAMGQINTPVQPFRFLDLPSEIRLLVYGYTDLISPLNKVQWDPDHGYTLDAPFCKPNCGPPYDSCHPSMHRDCGSPNTPICHCRHGLSSWHGGIPYCWTCTHYACQFITCNARPANGTELGLGCCGAKSSAYSPACHCWKPPVALFNTSRTIREETQRVFFSKNEFEIPHYKSSAYVTGAEAAPERCAAAIFLAEVVPADILPYLSKLTVSLWDCVKRASREDWSKIISYVVGISDLRFLSIDTTMGFDEITEAIPNTREELCSKQGLVAVKDAISQYAWPVVISETAVRSFFVDVAYIYSLDLKVYYSYRRPEDPAVLVGNERVAGDNYAFVRECAGPVGEQGNGKWLEGLHLFEAEDF